MEENDKSDLEFIQEDLDDASEEEGQLDVKIAEEHEKFKQAQAEYRASRPYSAPPLGSPLPEKQRERVQQSSMDGGDDNVFLAPRNDYMPPERPYLATTTPAKNARSKSYMGPARPMSADSNSRSPFASGLKQGILQDILEDAPLESPSDVLKKTVPRDGEVSSNAAADASSGEREDAAIAIAAAERANSLKILAASIIEEVATERANSLRILAASILEEVKRESETGKSEVQDPSTTSSNHVYVPLVAVPTMLAAEQYDREDDLLHLSNMSDHGSPELMQGHARTADNEEGTQEEEEEDSENQSAASTDFGDLVHPTTFALQLLAHDLRVLPAHQLSRKAVETQARGSNHSGVSLSQIGFLGLQGAETLQKRAGGRRDGKSGNSRPHSAVPRQQTSPASHPLLPSDKTLQQQQQKQQQRKTLRPGWCPPPIPLPASATKEAYRPPICPNHETLTAWANVNEHPASEMATDSERRWGNPTSDQIARPRHRPASARPAHGAGGDKWAPLKNGAPLSHGPLRRPQSANPGSRGWSSWDGDCVDADEGGGRTMMTMIHPSFTPLTHQVSIGGQSVSVYVADTMKRIGEANRSLTALGSSRRYQLKSPTSNMYVQLVEPRDMGLNSIDDYEDHVASRVIKTLTLAKFMSALTRLKAQLQQRGLRLGPINQRRTTDEEEGQYDVYHGGMMKERNMTVEYNSPEMMEGTCDVRWQVARKCQTIAEEALAVSIIRKDVHEMRL